MFVSALQLDLAATELSSRGGGGSATPVII